MKVLILLLILAGCAGPTHYSIVPANGPGYLPAYPDRSEEGCFR